MSAAGEGDVKTPTTLKDRFSSTELIALGTEEAKVAETQEVNNANVSEERGSPKIEIAKETINEEGESPKVDAAKEEDQNEKEPNAQVVETQDVIDANTDSNVIVEDNGPLKIEPR